MSDLLAVRYNSEPIILLYSLRSICFPPSLLSSLHVILGVPIDLGLVPNFLIISLIYLVWFINILFSFYLISKPRKYVSSPIILILKFSFIKFANSLYKTCLVAPKMISSIYTYTTSKLSFSFFKNNVVSIFSFLKPFSIRNLLSLSYHALGAYFKP